MLILSIVLWPAVSRRVTENDTRRAAQAKEIEAAEQQRRDEKRAANREKLKAMKPDQPLPDWYDLLEEDSGVRTEALEALRKVDRRQQDVQDGLNYGIQAVMRLAPDLDLQCTPELCRSAHAFLKKTADQMRIHDGSTPQQYQTNKYLEASLAGVTWFHTHGCNCDDGLADIESSVRAYVDTPDRRQLESLLARLKSTR